MEKPLSKKGYSLLYGIQTEQDLLFLGEKGKELISSIKSKHTIPQDSTIENICKEFPIESLCEKEVDKFTNEVRINTFRSRTFAFPHKHPIDLLYISKPEGERFYVLYTGLHWMESTSSIIFNINENSNIILQTNYNDKYLGKTYEEFVLEDHHKNKNLEYRSYLPISKEDFLKCCHAEHLSIRVCNYSSSIDYEEDCDELIPCFQMLYNQTSDNQIFTNNEEKWIQTFTESTKARFKKLYMISEQKREEENEITRKGLSEMLIWILIVVLGIACIFIFL